MPKFDTYRKHQYNATLYKYTSATGSAVGSATLTYSVDGPINVSVTQNIFGKIAVIFKEEDGHRLQQNSQLTNLTDANGNELYPGGVWTMMGIMPVITMFGYREGFKGDAKLTGVSGSSSL
jgi:hypothetical protein